LLEDPRYDEGTIPPVARRGCESLLKKSKERDKAFYLL